VWADLEAQYGDRLTMAMVDFDTNDGKEFARSYRVNYHPGFIAIDSEGEVVYAGLEIRTEEALRSLVERLLE
jgi:hypothetical protein